MTALEVWKARANEIVELKKMALAKGRNTITYTDCNGVSRNLYYHSGRWNDRPSTIGEY